MPISIRPHSPVLALLGIAAAALVLVAVFSGGTPRSAAEEGQYLHFTGPGSGYIEVPDAPALNPDSEITIEAWVFLTSGNGWGTDAEFEGCPTFVGKNYVLGWWFGLDCAGSTRLSFYPDGQDSHVLSIGSVPVGEWAHVAVTYDGFDVRFYINGALDSTVPAPGVPGSSDAPLRIGQDVEWDASPIGHIDEVHLWSIARSPAAVALDMDTITEPEVGLVGVWNMEGTPNADVGGFTGTLVDDAEFAGTPITPSPTIEPPFLKGDIDCDHSTTAADALPLILAASGVSGNPAPCVTASVLSAAGVPEWWNASTGEGYIEIPHDDALNPEDAITIEARVNMYSFLSSNAFNSCVSLVGKGYQTAYWLGVCSGRLRFYPRGTGSNVDSPHVLPLREWTHVAVVADHTSVKFYVNGELDSEFTNDDEPLATNANVLRIGSDASWNQIPWAALQEVRIWDVARTQEEIQADMDTAITPPQDGLVAVYHLAGGPADATGAHDGVESDALTYGTLPAPYWPDINCGGLIEVGDILTLIASVGGVPHFAGVPDGCEEIGTPTS